MAKLRKSSPKQRRRPAAKQAPKRKKAQGFCGSMRGSIIWMGDIISPIGEDWGY